MGCRRAMRSINTWRTWFLFLRDVLSLMRMGLLWSIRSARLLLNVECCVGVGFLRGVRVNGM